MNREIKFIIGDIEIEATNSYKQQGYVKRKAIGHPFPDKRGYVMEHRLVVEKWMGKFLPKNAIIHHKNGIRDDNRLENLEYLPDQERHAKHHAKDLRRNSNGQYVATDPIFAEIKFRLLNKNTGMMEIHTLGKLIATTYRRSQFSFRGRWTGLKDKNEKEVWEGDIVKRVYAFTKSGKPKETVNQIIYREDWGAFAFHGKTNIGKGWSRMYSGHLVYPFEVIGNIYENPELLIPPPNN